MTVAVSQLAVLAASLGERLLTDPDAVAPYLSDTSRVRFTGSVLGVVTAATTADVVTALAWANEHRVPVSVRGSGSGLSGGAVAYDGGLVISLAAMTRILEVDPGNRTADVEPGVIVADLDAAAERHGLMYAPDPASWRLASIGGTVATNAGGLRCLAHGTTKDAVLGLEVVLADGRIVTTGARTRKDSTGYDLTHLFTGSEGTLGVVTRVTVRLLPRPLGTPVTFRADFGSITDCGAAVSAIMASRVTPEVLELLDANTVRVIEQYAPGSIRVDGEAILVGRTVGAGALDDAELIAAACRAAGATTVEFTEGDALLEARRLANPALDAKALKCSCDVTVPPSRLAEMIAGAERIGREAGQLVYTLAHAGDGNLHPNVLVPRTTPEAIADAEAVLDRITEFAISLGGRISGEHGIGSLKTHELPLQFDAATLGVMHDIKRALDPNGILSPGRAI